MAKKSSSGVPYVRPNIIPSYSFVKDSTLISVYYNISELVEIFQESNNHIQRVTMSRNEYENFENKLKQNGFVLL